jgi:Fe-S cluster biogenesis protein NfuA
MTFEELQPIFENELNPAVAQDGGFIELVDVIEGFVRVRLHGACRGCPSSQSTLKMGVTAYLAELFPEDFVAVINITEEQDGNGQDAQ